MNRILANHFWTCIPFITTLNRQKQIAYTETCLFFFLSMILKSSDYAEKPTGQKAWSKVQHTSNKDTQLKRSQIKTCLLVNWFVFGWVVCTLRLVRCSLSIELETLTLKIKKLQPTVFSAQCSQTDRCTDTNKWTAINTVRKLRDTHTYACSAISKK